MRIKLYDFELNMELKEALLFLIFVVLLVIAYNLGVYDTIKLTEYVRDRCFCIFR